MGPTWHAQLGERLVWLTGPSWVLNSLPYWARMHERNLAEYVLSLSGGQKAAPQGRQRPPPRIQKQTVLGSRQSPLSTTGNTVVPELTQSMVGGSDILVLKIILVLVFIQFWGNNFYFSFSFSFEIILVSISVLVLVLK